MSTSPHIRVGADHAESNPGADPSATEVVVNALVVGSLLTERMEHELRGFGLTLGSFNLLTILAGADDDLTPTEIARRSLTSVTTATVTGLLDTCERKGLLRRVPHPSDGRRVLVRLTASGRSVQADAAGSVARAERRWVGPLVATRRSGLLRGLGELRLALEADAEE